MINLENRIKTIEGEFHEERRAMEERQKHAKSEILEKVKEIGELREKLNSGDSGSKEELDSLRDDLKYVQLERLEATRRSGFLENKIKNLEKKLADSNKLLEEQRLLSAGAGGGEQVGRSGGNDNVDRSPKRKQPKVLGDPPKTSDFVAPSVPAPVTDGPAATLGTSNAVAVAADHGANDSCQEREPNDASVTGDGPDGMDERSVITTVPSNAGTVDAVPTVVNGSQEGGPNGGSTVHEEVVSSPDMFESISNKSALEKVAREAEQQAEEGDEPMANVEELLEGPDSPQSLNSCHNEENPSNEYTEGYFGSPFSNI